MYYSGLHCQEKKREKQRNTIIQICSLEETIVKDTAIREIERVKEAF
jgi:hypothetical protein